MRKGKRPEDVEHVRVIDALPPIEQPPHDGHEQYGDGVGDRAAGHRLTFELRQVGQSNRNSQLADERRLETDVDPAQPGRSHPPMVEL
jgi:hypothetical protein